MELREILLIGLTDDQKGETKAADFNEVQL